VRTPRIVVVGAGMGGLAAAADLARQGAQVTVLERAAAPGGKLREVMVSGTPIDAGPTVFTMRWVFESLFADAGRRLDQHLSLQPVEVLARHAWRRGGRLDLYADPKRSAEAIGAFAGAAEARAFRAFCARAADIHKTLAGSFMAAQRPSPMELARRVGIGGLPALLRTAPHATLWAALGEHFSDPRLRQLFARYATYVGSSPFQAPATLMLIAHVESQGVWLVEGGMRRVADAMQALGEAQGAVFRFGAGVAEIVVERGRVAGVRLADGERLAADAVVFNGDAAALAQGLLGQGARGAVPDMARPARSLSAVTWCVRAAAAGFPLHHHNVFFAEDYADEFDAVFRRRGITAAPTVYVCAQDRGGDVPPLPGAAERLLLLVNAPADGDQAGAARLETAARPAAVALLRACGLELDWGAEVVTGPEGFARLFPGTGGALYGRANHSAMGSFARPGAVSKLPGLYLAGGSVHPGAGIPMAALSGRLAAVRVLGDLGRRAA